MKTSAVVLLLVLSLASCAYQEKALLTAQPLTPSFTNLLLQDPETLLFHETSPWGTVRAGIFDLNTGSPKFPMTDPAVYPAVRWLDRAGQKELFMKGEMVRGELMIRNLNDGEDHVVFQTTGHGFVLWYSMSPDGTYAAVVGCENTEWETLGENSMASDWFVLLISLSKDYERNEIWRGNCALCAYWADDSDKLAWVGGVGTSAEDWETALYICDGIAQGKPTTRKVLVEGESIQERGGAWSANSRRFCYVYEGVIDDDLQGTAGIGIWSAEAGAKPIWTMPEGVLAYKVSTAWREGGDQIACILRRNMKNGWRDELWVIAADGKQRSCIFVSERTESEEEMPRLDPGAVAWLPSGDVALARGSEILRIPARSSIASSEVAVQEP